MLFDEDRAANHGIAIVYVCAVFFLPDGHQSHPAGGLVVARDPVRATEINDLAAVDRVGHRSSRRCILGAGRECSVIKASKTYSILQYLPLLFNT